MVLKWCFKLIDIFRLQLCKNVSSNSWRSFIFCFEHFSSNIYWMFHWSIVTVPFFDQSSPKEDCHYKQVEGNVLLLRLCSIQIKIQQLNSAVKNEFMRSFFLSRDMYGIVLSRGLIFLCTFLQSPFTSVSKLSLLSILMYLQSKYNNK